MNHINQMMNTLVCLVFIICKLLNLYFLNVYCIVFCSIKYKNKYTYLKIFLMGWGVFCLSTNMVCINTTCGLGKT